MIVAVILLSALLQAALAGSTDESGRFSFGSSETTESASDTSDSTGATTSDTISSDAHRAQRLERDQRRIELAVQAALLKNTQELAAPIDRDLDIADTATRSIQATLSTVNANITLDPFNSSVTATTRPVFGPVAVVLYTSPADGLFGPERTRQQVVALDQRNTFGTLFAEIRRAGFFGEFELRTLVQSDATFSLTTRALTTPCFPISKEPGLTLELIALTQGNLVGVLRETFLVRDKFFPVGSDEPELEAGAEGIALKKFNNVSKLFDETDFDVAFLRFEQCQQFSYFL